MAATYQPQSRLRAPVSPRPSALIFSKPRAFWLHNAEARLNWLALGLLLAAWNAAGDEGSSARARAPDVLRGYSSISVRAAHRSIASLR